jgi:phage gp36-like protein
LYAAPSDVADFAFPQDAIASVPAGVQAFACLAATDEAATYLAGRFTLPLTEWTTDLTMHVAMMAGYQIMKRRGFQPQGFDELIVKGRDDAIAYLKMIATNKLYPPGFVDSLAADVGTNDAFIVENPTTQWDAIGGGPVDSTFGDLTTRM